MLRERERDTYFCVNVLKRRVMDVGIRHFVSRFFSLTLHRRGEGERERGSKRERMKRIDLYSSIIKYEEEVAATETAAAAEE